MNLSWEAVGMVITAVGGILVGFWTYRAQSKKDTEEGDNTRQRLLLEREQALITHFQAQLDDVYKELQAERELRRTCERLLLDMQRQLAALERKIDKLTGNGGGQS